MELENKSTETFHKNIQYLAQQHKKIYNKLLAYDTGVENGTYKNNYELVINEDNYFDILEPAKKNYLYGMDSYEYAVIAAFNTTFKKDENVFETFRKLPFRSKNNIFSDIAPSLKYIEENIQNSQEMKVIKKFIFFGTGLGTHITTIDQKINAQMYFIIEDNIEIFKFSLFVTPYYDLALKAELTFSVSDTKDEFSNTANNFLVTKFYNNHYIKYFEMMHHNEEKLKEFHIKVISQSQNIFFYKDILTQYLTPLQYMQENSMFLNMLASYSDSSLDTKPVLLLAAGPSLQANAAWLKENKNKFIIVALSSTLNLLEKENIIPDIVTHMDAFESSTAHFDKLKSLAFLDNTLFLFSARIQESIVKKLNKEHIFFYENGTSYKQDIGNLSAPCVGSTTYLILLALGVSELYLLGLDLALDAKTGATHSNEHHFNEKLDLDSASTHTDVLEFSKAVIKTTGNFQEEVYTKPEYMLSIDSVNASSMGFKKDTQNVYNLNDGAKFLNTISKKIEDIDLNSFNDIDKQNISQELKDSFTNKSSSSTTKNELQAIKDKLQQALLLKEIVIAQQSYYFSSYNEFLGSIVMLFSRLTSDASPKGRDISLIIQEYSKLIYTFIFDFFNTKNLNNTNEHVIFINKSLSNGLLNILDEYITKLDKSSTLHLG